MKPIMQFKARGIVAAVWENPVLGKEATFKSVTFSRRYRDKNGDWQSSNTLRQSDLPKAQLVLSEAYEYLSMNPQIWEEVSN